MISDLSWMPFKNISLDDPFFESLKDDYPGFDVWFKKKSLNGDKALVLLEEERIHAFLALKDENEEIVLTGNILPAIARLKISTLKIDEKVGGQRLGEGLIGVALWHWQKVGVEEIYVTIFEKQEKLIGLLKRFGFVCQGCKVNGELVFLKSRKNLDYSDAYKAFPFLSPNAPKAGIIPIKDGFHDRLFPYSESYYANEIEGTTAGNGITKVYIGTPYTATHYMEGEIVELKKALDVVNDEESNIREFLKVVNGYTEIEGLTPEILNNFIDRIYIGEKYADGSAHKQEIRIIYKFIGAESTHGYKVKGSRVAEIF